MTDDSDETLDEFVPEQEIARLRALSPIEFLTERFNTHETISFEALRDISRRLHRLESAINALPPDIRKQIKWEDSNNSGKSCPPDQK